MTREGLHKERQALRNSLKKTIDRLFVINLELDLYGVTKAQIIAVLAKHNEPITTVDILSEIYADEPIEMNVPEYRRKAIMSISLILNRLCKSGIVKGETIKGQKGKQYKIINK